MLTSAKLHPFLTLQTCRNLFQVEMLLLFSEWFVGSRNIYHCYNSTVGLLKVLRPPSVGARSRGCGIMRGWQERPTIHHPSPPATTPLPTPTNNNASPSHFQSFKSPRILSAADKVLNPNPTQIWKGSIFTCFPPDWIRKSTTDWTSRVSRIFVSLDSRYKSQ